MAKPKMEFDKDYIYNLIMPSVPPANASEAPAAAADMPASSPEAVTAPSAEEDEDNPISDLRSRLFFAQKQRGGHPGGQARICCRQYHGAACLRPAGQRLL